MIAPRFHWKVTPPGLVEVSVIGLPEQIVIGPVGVTTGAVGDVLRVTVVPGTDVAEHEPLITVTE